MKNINHLLDIVGQSQYHIPALLSLILGFTVIKKNPSIFFRDNEIVGDNIPITIIDERR